MTRRPVKVVHSRANPAMVWLLPAPAGATSTVVAAAAVSIMHYGVALLSAQPGALDAGPGLLVADELRHGPFRGWRGSVLRCRGGPGCSTVPGSAAGRCCRRRRRGRRGWSRRRGPGR